MRAYTRFMGFWEKSATVFVECQGRLLFDTMEASLLVQNPWAMFGLPRPTGPDRGPCHATSCSEQTTCLHTLSYPKLGWNTMAHSQTLHRAMVWSLRECSLAF